MKENIALEGDEVVITPEEIKQAEDEFKSASIDADTFFMEEVDGRKELLVFEGEDKAKLVVYSDLTAQQETNKALFNEGKPQGSEFFRIASFPTAFLDVYGFKHNLPFQWYYDKLYMPLLMRMAHDSDYRDFRTTPGHFIRKGGG